jgi:hypothetical protein
MKRTILAAAAIASVAIRPTPLSAQTTSTTPRAVTYTAYSKSTEFFAEWRPLIAGQSTRLTAHLTDTADRFTPYVEGKVTLTLTVDGVASNASADAPERRSWEEEFATAPVTARFQGAARMLTLPVTAIVRDASGARVYVQRTPSVSNFAR